MTPSQIVTARNATLAANPNLNVYLELAENQTSLTWFSPLNRDLAVALRALHMLALDARKGTGGQVTSEREGGLARSYAVIPPMHALQSTAYGQELYELILASNLPVMNRMVPG